MIPVAILAGGLATRLRPVTEAIPKALVPIDGEPFLAHQLRLLKRSGITQVVLCVGYLGEKIREFASTGREFGLEVEYSFDGPHLLGTGGAIRRALPLLGKQFFVLYGDSYLPCDYGAVERAFLESGKAGLMTVFRNAGRWDRSNIEFSEGRIVRYDKVHSVPEMQYIDYGLGIFRAEVVDALPAEQVHDLAAVYQDLLRRNRLAAYEVSERFYEIGSMAGIQELRDYLSKAKRRAVFLDRDGVLNEPVVRNRRPYPPSTMEDLKIIPGAGDTLRALQRAGFLLIVVTNQPDVARGSQTRRVVEELNTAIRTALPIDDLYVCYHDEQEGCGCRKPKPGLLIQAAAKWNIDLRGSFLIGDRWRDIDAGAAAGCRTVLIDYGYDERGPLNEPAYRAKTLAHAANWILLQ